jgi:rod shape-determining protein MreD
MRSDYFIPFLLFAVLLILQTTVVNLISINGIVPDFILILLVFYSVKNNQIYGMILGFIFGFLFDLITGSLLGSSVISKTLAGFTAGYFSNENKREFYLSSYAFPLIVLLCGIIDSFIFSFFSSSDLRSSFVFLMLQQGVYPGIYTAAISMVVVFFMPKRSFI